MTNRSSTTSALPHPAAQARCARTSFGYPAGAGPSQHPARRVRAGYAPLPALEEALERLRGYRSPLAELTAKQRAEIPGCEGPESWDTGTVRNGPL